jgi:hypothetical protein
LPTFLSITDEPRLRAFGDVQMETRQADDEGVPTRSVILVERGVLKTLLTTRVPVEGLRRSTGSRRGHGPQVSNLVFTVDSGLSRDALRRELLRAAAARGLAYGVVVRRVASSEGAMFANPFAFLSRFAAGDEGESVLATAAFRVYPDGREEPIRAPLISGLTAAAFRDIMAASAERRASTLTVNASRPFVRTGRQAFSPVQSEDVATFVVPDVLFEELVIEPPSGEPPRLPIPRPPRDPD